ncbi:MAG TPA: hypothetical protein VG838_15320 [Opitutaceae bacterium]|nr:hypothetical protein [Opitutaceae bacterium]
MDMNLQPLATTCFVTGQPFVEGQRVASFLVRTEQSADVIRHDVREDAVGSYRAPGYVACSWVHAYKPRRPEENSDRVMKLTAENLFVTLADPAAEPTAENTRLIQFLALLLERKRLLRPKGRNADGTKNVYEHAKSKQVYEVAVGELDPPFFLQVQTQLSVLVGPQRGPAEVPQPAAV